MTKAELRANRVSQNALRPEKPSGPCFYRTLQAAAEDKVDVNLTLEQINAATKDLFASGAIREGDGESTYYVENPAEVVDDALSRLGYPDAVVTVSDKTTEIDKDADYTARVIQSRGHYQLGDKKGDLLWEPFDYADPASSYTGKPDFVRNIIIKEPRQYDNLPYGSGSFGR